MSAGIDALNLGGRALDVNAFGQYYEFPQEDYFGVGMDSLESNRTNYLLDVVETGGAVHWRPYKLDFGGGVSYLSPRVGSGTDSRFASTEEVFSPETTPGLGTATDFIKVQASAAFDWRDNPSYPHSGGRYEVAAAKFDDHDLGQFDFYRVDVTCSTTSRWPAAIACSPSAPSARSRMLTAASPCPSIFSRRSAGTGICAGSASRAFETKTRCCSAPSTAGKRGGHSMAPCSSTPARSRRARRDLSLSNMEVSYGIGFRFHSNSALVGRLDLAFSREGFVPLLRFEHVF